METEISKMSVLACCVVVCIHSVCLQYTNMHFGMWLCGFSAVEGDKQPISQWPVFNPPPVPGLPVSVEPDQVNCTGQGFARDPNNCKVYYRCEWGMRHTYICPESLHYDSSLKLCNWPHIANCENRPPASGTHKKTQTGLYIYIYEHMCSSSTGCTWCGVFGDTSASSSHVTENYEG